MVLSKDAILAADDIEYREVDVPEWGGTVRLKALTGAARDSYEDSMTVQRGNRLFRSVLNARAKLVALAAVDEDGNRLFTDKEAAVLGERSSAVLDRLFDIVSEMSKLTEEDVQELGKDSATDPSGSSTSTSPSNSNAEQ